MQSRYPWASALWLVLLSHFPLPLAAQSWWDSQFGYRRQMLVETGANAPYNGYKGYTVRLEGLDTAAMVEAGELSDNCGDLRLAYWDGSNWTEVERHLIDCNTAASEIRFMLQADIAANGSDDGYYLYHGAPTLSSPPTPLGTDNVYLWYDDGSENRLDSYVRGRGDDWHGSGWGNSFRWHGDGYYTYDTDNDATDSLRRKVAERDLYIEAEFYHLDAYQEDMTSGLLARYRSVGSGAEESSSHYYASNRADSPFQNSSGYAHDLSIMKQRRGTVAIDTADGADAPEIAGDQWRKQALAIWGTNQTNGKFWDDDVSADLGSMGWPSVSAQKAGTDSDDSEGAGDAGLIVCQDKARVDNILIRRYVEPEPTLSLATEDDTSSLDHLRILHDGEGLTCEPEEVTIQACETSNCDTLYTEEVTVNLSPTGWDGGDSLTFSGGQTTAQLGRTSVGTVTLGASSRSPTASNPTRCFIGATEECDMDFVDEGLVFNVPDQVSCETSEAVTLQALRSGGKGGRCKPAFREGGAKTINFWFDYTDPSNGTRSLNINGSEVSGSAPGTAISLTFDAFAQASFTVSYADAGRLQLNAYYEETLKKKRLELNGNDQFVVRPESLYSRATTDDGETLLNNASSDDAPSWTAGKDFHLQLRAQCADGTLLPNYQPTNAELWVEMSNPAQDGGALTLLDSSFAAVTTEDWNNISDLFSSGVVAESDQNASDSDSYALARFSEVGVLTLYLRDESYMGGTISPADDLVVGRFKPAYFEVSSLTNGQLEPSCNSAFSYTGTAMNYAEQPTMLITAHQEGGGVTTHYTGEFSKLSGTQGSISFESPTQDTDQLGADQASHTALSAVIQSNLANIVDNEDGTFDYSLSSEDSFTYTRNANALIGPYTSNMSLVLKAVEDGDGVSDDGSAVSLTPVGSEIRFGRLVVDDAYGPQTRDLPVPVRAEYYDGGDFIDNADDYCTTIAPLTAGSLDNWQGNLVEGETDLSDSSGLLLAGSGEIVLSAPGAGTDGDTNDGSVDLTLDLSITDTSQEWLLNDEDGDGLYEENPLGTASFGMYRGDDRFIYWRENP
jgi:MSHA biogenesis protein MshQ